MIFVYENSTTAPQSILGGKTMTVELTIVYYYLCIWETFADRTTNQDPYLVTDDLEMHSELQRPNYGVLVEFQGKPFKWLKMTQSKSRLPLMEVALAHRSAYSMHSLFTFSSTEQNFHCIVQVYRHTHGQTAHSTYANEHPHSLR